MRNAGESNNNNNNNHEHQDTSNASKQQHQSSAHIVTRRFRIAHSIRDTKKISDLQATRTKPIIHNARIYKQEYGRLHYRRSISRRLRRFGICSLFFAVNVILIDGGESGTDR